jgi:hypothetical protein
VSLEKSLQQLQASALALVPWQGEQIGRFYQQLGYFLGSLKK